MDSSKLPRNRRTNSLDYNERLSFIQRQVGRNSTKMIIEHYYNMYRLQTDGKKLKSAWKKDQNLTRPHEMEKLSI